jgi:hypothetical protein
VVPLLVGIGAGLVAYTSRILSVLRRPRQDEPAGALLARRSASVFVYVLIVASIFWVNATIAQWSGRGLAQYTATHLDALPSVILDTKEELYLRDPCFPGIQCAKGSQLLPLSPGQTFRYRYHGLRLLIVGQDRMFLVPDHWSGSDSALIVPLDGSVRIQFQFVNDPP